MTKGEQDQRKGSDLIPSGANRQTNDGRGVAWAGPDRDKGCMLGLVHHTEGLQNF